MKKSLTIDGILYPSKSRVAAKAKQILYKYPIGVELSAEDRNFVLSLLGLRNPETQKEKTGSGIVSVSAMHPSEFRNARTFCLHRSDGSWTDFSYGKALENVNNAGAVKRAARYEVREQIAEYRAKHYNGRCSLTGQEIGVDLCHVDHIPPDTFDVLFSKFLKAENKNIKDIESIGVGDRQIGTLFVDRELAERWKKYHRSNAKLRIISVKANLSMVPKVRGDYESWNRKCLPMLSDTQNRE